MVEIKPFKGLLYNPEKINDFSSVVAPPYDIISENKRDELYDKSEYGVIRLILGKEKEKDTALDNKYSRAKKDLQNWIKQGIMVEEDKDALYVYSQEYKVDGEKYFRAGFIGLMKMQDSGKNSILPHEYTLARPKQDRMNLITQVKSNLSPIFMLFNDGDSKVTDILKNKMKNGEPRINLDIDGVIHKLWVLRDKNKIGQIISEFRGRKTFIADGHHRFEVARRYREIRKKEDRYDGNADYVMVYFTDMSREDNLKVFPTHRVVKKLSLEENSFLDKLKKYFTLESAGNMDSLRRRLEEERDKPNIFGLFFHDKYYLLIPDNVQALRALITEKRSDYWKELDVSVLQYAVFDKILDLGNIEENVSFVKTFEEAGKLVKNGSHDAAFFLNATRVAQLKAVAELGEMMPQKSTYFYPKLLSGLVINRFNSVTANV